MRKLMNKYMLSISKTAAGMIDGDEFAGLSAEYEPETDKSYMDVFRRADTRMYKDKAAYYMEHGDRRNRDNKSE